MKVESKKGSARDVVLLGALGFAVGLMFFLLAFVANNLSDNLAAEPAFNNNTYINASLNAVDTVNNSLDYIIFMFFLAFILGVIITSWFIGGYPVFMFFYVIIVVVGVIVSFALSNMWDSVTQMAAFGTTINLFPITNHIMLNLPLYICIIGFIGIVVMFGRGGGEGVGI